jgi:apolipoprotein N-acyltransferase
MGSELDIQQTEDRWQKAEGRNYFLDGAFVAAALLSAVAFYFGAGLHPVGWLMWVAPLPVLLLVPRLSWRAALLLAFSAHFLGTLSFWDYLRNYIHFPFWVTLQSLLLPAIPFALAVLFFRFFFRRGEFALAVLAFPAVIIVSEFFTDRVLGTFGNTAYTQLNNLPALQLAALAGLWGIGFTVTFFPSAAAGIILSRGAARRGLALALAGLMVGVVGYGVWRLNATPSAEHTVVVGLVSTQYSGNVFPSTDSQKMQTLEGYAAQARALAARGAKIVVLPEMSVLVSGALSDKADALFEQTARDAHAQALLGVLNVTAHAAFNEARLYAPTGKIEAIYRKRHLVPDWKEGQRRFATSPSSTSPRARWDWQFAAIWITPIPRAIMVRTGLGSCSYPLGTSMSTGSSTDTWRSCAESNTDTASLARRR